MYDRNPKVNQDKNKRNMALKVADMLWDSSQGDLSRVPQQYLDSLGFEYSDGSVSLLNLVDKVDFDSETSYDEFKEVVENLVDVNPDKWPDPDSIEEIQTSKLLYEIEPDPVNFSEEDLSFDFADPSDMTAKMSLFLKKTIASVYTDGVTSVTDANGNPPNEENNYLLSDDGKTFSGIFYDAPPNEKAKQYPFTITESSEGKWTIKY